MQPFDSLTNVDSDLAMRIGAFRPLDACTESVGGTWLELWQLEIVNDTGEFPTTEASVLIDGDLLAIFH